ncbi:class I SAM-dependent methyltransferase [Bacillus marinisedimentorum]|uniref:class I SAM-dependent methyltransferase n=1 Tax=Bacillus marinisedimentorum TaxID=1821260 RepID=UPI0007E1A43D|nr:class I SAM-dependent methyltransferase [Bacillus marinisedimentorum]
MEYKGPSVYDNEAFLENYLARRNRAESPNNTIELPVFLEMIGDVNGQTVLDMGSGDGSFGIELLKRGAAYYEGVEGSERMAVLAKGQLAGTNSKISRSSLETWPFPESKYDLAVSRLVLHYIENLTEVLSSISNALKAGGRLVFSVQHPVLTASMKSAEQEGKRTDWIVDDYFKIGKRSEPWIGEQVVKYHRTTEEYVRLVRGAGFRIEDIREGTPRKEQFGSAEEYERRMRIPLFLMFSCIKV